MRAQQLGVVARAVVQHIEKQIDRCYAVKEGQPSLFKPTKLGEALVTGYAHMDMKNMWRPVLRSVMERNIAAVARGQMEKAAFLQGALSACEQVRARVSPVCSKCSAR